MASFAQRPNRQGRPGKTLDPHRQAQSVYGPKARAWAMHTRTGRRQRTEVMHLMVTTCGRMRPLGEDLRVADCIGETVARLKEGYFPVTVHTWATWPDWLELLVDGPPELHSRAVGQLKGAITRLRTDDPVVWSSTWGVPITTAQQRLFCLNHLRGRMLELESRALFGDVLPSAAMDHPNVFRPEDHAVFTADKMGKATLFRSDNLLVGLNAFEPGQAHDLHTHADMDKVYFVLQGTGVFALADRELPMAPGDMLVAPKGVAHGIRNHGEERLVVMATLAPAP